MQRCFVARTRLAAMPNLLHPVATMQMRRFSYWESELPPEPLPARELPRRVDVLIVGAGFMGRWLAYFLSKRNQPARVLVIDRDRFSYGASSRNAGFLTCGQVSEMLADVEHAGPDRVIETFLQRREGISIARYELPEINVEPCGSTDYDEVTDGKLALMAKLNAAAGEEIYSVRAARIGHDVRPCVFNNADGAVHPVKLLRVLQGRASGVGYEFGVNAVKVGNGVAELETIGGRHELAYERAFICTNGFASELDPESLVQPGRGQVIVTSKVHTRTDRTLGYLNAGYDYFRFVDDRLLIGGGRDKFRTEQTARELESTEEVCAYLKRVAGEVIGHTDWQVEHQWAGIMGFVSGEHLGGSPRRRLDDKTEVLAGFGGMGVALTPLHAKQIAAEDWV